MNNLFGSELTVINVGIQQFSEDIKKQGGKVVQLDWAPPGFGNSEVLEALARIETPENMEKIKQANEEVFQRITNGRIFLTGYQQAIDVVPNMTKNTILHAGPPITWEKMNGPMQGAVLGQSYLKGWQKI